jgi:hypothetical protein
MKLKLIICGREDGLGIRILNYTYSKIIAEKLGIKHLMLWPTESRHCKCSFRDIFNIETNQILDINTNEVRNNIFSLEYIKEHINKHYDIDLNLKNIKHLNLKNEKITSEILNTYDIILYKITKVKAYIKILNPKNISMNIQQFFSFNLNPHIEEGINKYSYLFNNFKIVSFHIRRGDIYEGIVENKHIKRGTVPLENFYKVIDTGYYDSNEYLFFVSSDTDKTTEDFFRRNNKLITLDNGEQINKCFYIECDSQDRSEAIAIQDAVIPMYLMSKSHVIYGSKSAFSYISALLGNMKKYDVHFDLSQMYINHINDLKKIMLEKEEENSNLKKEKKKNLKKEKKKNLKKEKKKNLKKELKRQNNEKDRSLTFSEEKIDIEEIQKEIKEKIENDIVLELDESNEFDNENIDINIKEILEHKKESSNELETNINSNQKELCNLSINYEKKKT